MPSEKARNTEQGFVLESGVDGLHFSGGLEQQCHWIGFDAALDLTSYG
jgi:hypothetical protein